MNVFTFSSIFAILLAVNSAVALQCYKCNSKDNKLCDWGFTSFTYSTEECEHGLLDKLITPKCFKITAEGKDGSSYIARGCSPPGTISAGCSATAQAIGWISSNTDDQGLRNLNCETCETDKCNSAQITAVSIFAMLIAAMAFLF